MPPLSRDELALASVFAAFLGMAVPLGAETVEVQAENASDRLFAGPLGVFAIEGESISARTARQVGSLDLGARGGYFLEMAEAEGRRLAFAGDELWGATCTVENAICRTRIEVAEPVKVVFTRTGDEPVEAPDLLVARVWRRAADSEDSIVCTKSAGESAWSCARPACDIDLRFDLAGHAPAFVWQTSEPGRSAGSPVEIPLEPGAAVEAWVEASEGEASLLPSGRRWEVSDARRAFAAHEAEIGSVDPPRARPGGVHAGDTPIAGTLVFGTTQGATSIRLASDEDGRFEGYLPREGTWEVEISEQRPECGTCADLLGVNLLPPVDVEVGPSGDAILDLALPDTEISGRVFRQDGAERVPVEGAQVMGLTGDGGPGRMGRRLQLWTDEDGRFTARGIEPATLEIGAISEEWGAESSWVRVEIVDGIETPEIELKIVPKVTLPVRVTAGGTAKAGARVHAFPEGGSSAHGTTDLDGVAELRTGQNSSGTLVVDALGHGLHVERFEVGRETSPGRTIVASPEAGDLLFEGFRAPPYEGTLHRGGAAVSLHVLRNFTPSRVRVTPEGVVVAGLAPGEYVLCGPEAARCRAVSITAGGVVSVSRADWWESAK